MVRVDKKEKWFSPMNIFVAILIAILIISASVTVALFDRGSYERLQAGLGLSEAAGMPETELMENYNALIDYNSVFFTGPLEFPTLPMSEAGRVHFAEVKAIFSALQIMLIVSAVLTAVFGVLLLKKRRLRFIAFGGILTLAIPAFIVCVMAATGWDRFFVLFHQVFFNNDFWVFDSVTDPVILILPDAFFLDCLIRIVAGIVIPAVILIVVPILLRRKIPDKVRQD